MKCHSPLPASSTSMWINSIGLTTSLSVILIVNIFKIPFFPVTLVILCLFAYAMPIILLEWKNLKTYQNTSTGLNFSNPPNSFNLKRATIKLLGLFSTLSIAGFIYWVFPHYSEPLYYHYFSLLKLVLPLYIALSVPYFIIVDRFMKVPKDAYWMMGQLCLFNFKTVNDKELLQHFLAWLVKLFFLPLMFTFFFDLVLFFQATSISVIALNFNQFFEITFKLLIYVDLLIGTVGYIITLRILDSHVRTTEPSFLGWFVVLQCYPPFSDFINGTYLTYSSENSWGFWLVDQPLLYPVWGILILVLTTIYVWSSLPFGIRFSNLTHRGLITNGPYKYCKHPAYLSKNLSWWFISMPFLSTVGAADAIKHCLLLLLVNCVYFLRARTEERHLSWDVDYRNYAEYIEKFGIFSYIGKYIPVLKFKSNRLFNIAD